MKNLKDTSFDQGTHIIEFLRSHPFISVSKVEKAAEMPKSSLLAAMTGKRNIPIQHWYKLNNVLSNYGYSLGDAVQADPPGFFEAPFSELNITIMNGDDIHIYKNYKNVNEVIEFIDIVSIALERRLDSEIEKHGNEFVIKSRLLKHQGF